MTTNPPAAPAPSSETQHPGLAVASGIAAFGVITLSWLAGWGWFWFPVLLLLIWCGVQGARTWLNQGDVTNYRNYLLMADAPPPATEGGGSQLPKITLGCGGLTIATLTLLCCGGLLGGGDEEDMAVAENKAEEWDGPRYEWAGQPDVEVSEEDLPPMPKVGSRMGAIEGELETIERLQTELDELSVVSLGGDEGLFQMMQVGAFWSVVKGDVRLFNVFDESNRQSSGELWGVGPADWPTATTKNQLLIWIENLEGLARAARPANRQQRIQVIQQYSVESKRLLRICRGIIKQKRSELRSASDGSDLREALAAVEIAEKRLSQYISHGAEIKSGDDVDFEQAWRDVRTYIEPESLGAERIEEVLSAPRGSGSGNDRQKRGDQTTLVQLSAEVREAIEAAVD